jgi:rSAM/selenodomain-associated transferase 1
VTVRLCIFARVPRRGQVKSRLAARLGEQGAYDAHCELVEHTLGRLAQISGIPAALWLDGAAEARAGAWSEKWRVPLRQQVGPELGARMEHALFDCLEDRSSGLVVGTDCPPIDAAYVRRAAAALERHDLVFGPAADGGFGLVGVSRVIPGLFADIEWGRASVLAATLANATRQRLRICLLPQIWDVDTPADWDRWLRERRGSVRERLGGDR